MWHNNGRQGSPVPPDVAGGPVLGAECKGIVPVRAASEAPAGAEAARRTVRAAVVGAVLAAIGGALASQDAALLAPVLMGAGVAWALSRASWPQGLAAPVAAAALAVACAAPLGVATLSNAVVLCASSVAVAWLAACGRLTPGAACASVALTALAHLAGDAALAAASGTSLSASFNEVMAVLGEELSTDAATVAAFQELTEWVALMWPSFYTMLALVEVLLARLGAGLALARGGACARDAAAAGTGVELVAAGEPGTAGEKAAVPDGTTDHKAAGLGLAFFDLPLWTVAALVAAAAGLAVALTWPELAEPWPLMVSANLLAALRLAFAAQGLGVLVWLGSRKGMAPVVKLLLGLAAFYLETQFYVLTAAGLIDVWANFRHLARGAEVASSHDAPAQHDQKPA